MLDPTLIYGFGLGVRGAAIATVTGRAAMLAVAAALVRRRAAPDQLTHDHSSNTAANSRPAAALSLAAPKPAMPAAGPGNSPRAMQAAVPDPDVAMTGGAAIAVLEAPILPPLPRRDLIRSALDVARAGTPLGIDFLVRMAGATALAGVVAGFGVTAVAAYGIGTKAMYFASMAFYAVRQAATIHSARNAPHRRIGMAAVAVGGALVLVAGVLYAGAAPWIMAAFTGRAEVIAVGVVFLRWLAVYLVPTSMVISLSGALAAGRGGNRLLPVTVGGTVVLVLLAYVLAGPFGLAGVWAAMAGSATLQCAALLLLLLLLLRGQRR